jgi:serine/threonine protein kinase
MTGTEAADSESLKSSTPSHTAALPGLIQIARAGLSEQVTSEAVLWENLDLDDPDDRRFGDYDLLERIGRGGMGVVFRARQISLCREVAVKFIIGDLSENSQAVERLLAEARAAARLHHPNIVPVLEVGSMEGMHFFSMPLMRGQTLAQRLSAAPLSTADSVRLMLKLTGAVDYAHSLGLLHLDLKPGNILFDEHQQPLIGDFGLARHMDEAGEINAREISGTPAYMAPEQRRDGSHRLSRQTDIYALGAILYELLTGAPPNSPTEGEFSEDGSADAGVVQPAGIPPQVEKDLAAICLKCLHPDPSQRYQQTVQLTEDLTRYRDGNSVSVRHAPWRERIVRNLHRHPTLSVAIGAGIFALLLGLATTSWQWQRAERARAEARQQQDLAIAQATRMQQLAGLMAAAFPAEDSAWDDRVSSARNAVAWLKQHTPNDPSAQRAVLTSFRQALSAENKGDAIDMLLSEIVDQLGQNFRQTQVARLLAKGDRDSLIAAVLIGVPRGAEELSSPEHEVALRRLFEGYSNDSGALYVAAMACHVQTHPCRHPEFFARLVKRFPDNAVHWVLLPSGENPTDEGLATLVMMAAKAQRFDDRHFAYADVLRAALHDQPVPDSILQPMQAVVDAADAIPSLQRDTMDNVPYPNYQDFARLCKPDSDAIHRTPTLAGACGQFAELGLRSRNATILSRMICSVILRRLYPGSPLAAEAFAYRRQYVWLSEQVRSLKNNRELLQQQSEQFGEWEALQRYAERAGATRTPPSDWKPANPQQLLLPEERAANPP